MTMHSSEYKYPQKAGIKDKIQLVNSFLMSVLGVILLVRLLAKSILSPFPLLVGFGFLGLGLYRLHHFYLYYKIKRRGKE